MSTKRPSDVTDFAAALVANKSTQTLWGNYAGHRLKTTELLANALSKGPSPSRVLLVGAGNCNDVELRVLLALGARITLLDIDGAAMSEGLLRQRLLGHPQLRLIEDDVDLFEPNQQFNVVASMCMLSQYLGRSFDTENTVDPAFFVALRRRNHLERLASWVVPSAASSLIITTDIVSSETVSLPMCAATSELLVLARELVMHGNFFTGCNPGAIMGTLENWRCRALNSWVWDMDARRYLVVSLMFDFLTVQKVESPYLRPRER